MIDEGVAQRLADEITIYVYGRRDKKEDDFLKSNIKKNKKGEIVNGAMNARLLSIVKMLSENKEEILKIEKSKKTKGQSSLDFQKNKYGSLLSLIDKEVVNTDLLDLKSEYHEFSLHNTKEHNVVKWLTQWASKAKDISFATHVGKLTHSSSKGSSILDITEEKNDHYLTTNSLNNMEVDTASSNAASLPIADVLKLTANGISVLDCLKNGEKELFEKLTDDDVLIDEWNCQLKQAYDSTKKQSYFLSKQIYFPVKDNQYHLLLPLTSSSLVHELHLEHKRYWDEEQEVAREQKRNKKHSGTITKTYPQKAYLHVTGSNHSNASSLNGKRGGRISLLPTMPPQWQSDFQFNINKPSVFDKTLSFELKHEIDDLRKYLVLIKSKSLSISEPKRNAAVMNKLRAVSDNFFNYVEKINSSMTGTNWSRDASLPIEQQLLFEPWRVDETARGIKTDKQWEKTLSQSYGRWLTKLLKQKNKLPLTVIHEALWADVFALELREFISIQEVIV
ncbi:MAG: type I-F CRISPR-associated protein Csy1 [Pseudomonadales bacterium]|nr:type I-F CRISPR-associated protein Csy1 [Pseudomonadales bacterium]